MLGTSSSSSSSSGQRETLSLRDQIARIQSMFGHLETMFGQLNAFNSRYSQTPSTVTRESFIRDMLQNVQNELSQKKGKAYPTMSSEIGEEVEPIDPRMIKLEENVQDLKTWWSYLGSWRRWNFLKPRLKQTPLLASRLAISGIVYLAAIMMSAESMAVTIGLTAAGIGVPFLLDVHSLSQQLEVMRKKEEEEDLREPTEGWFSQLKRLGKYGKLTYGGAIAGILSLVGYISIASISSGVDMTSSMASSSEIFTSFKGSDILVNILLGMSVFGPSIAKEINASQVTYREENIEQRGAEQAAIRKKKETIEQCWERTKREINALLNPELKEIMARLLVLHHDKLLDNEGELVIPLVEIEKRNVHLEKVLQHYQSDVLDEKNWEIHDLSQRQEEELLTCIIEPLCADLMGKLVEKMGDTVFLVGGSLEILIQEVMINTIHTEEYDINDPIEKFKFYDMIKEPLNQMGFADAQIRALMNRVRNTVNIMGVYPHDDSEVIVVQPKLTEGEGEVLAEGKDKERKVKGKEKDSRGNNNQLGIKL